MSAHVVCRRRLLAAVTLVAFAATLRLAPAATEDNILGHNPGMPAAAGAGTSNNSSSDAAYMSNLNALAAVLVAGARASGSADAAADSPPGAAYGLALCRGSFTGDACAGGQRDALSRAVNDSEGAFGCGPPRQRDITLFYDRYQLRLSGDDILSRDAGGGGEEPRWAGNNTNFVARADSAGRFVALVHELVTAVAASRPGRYATGRSWFDEQGLTWDESTRLWERFFSTERENEAVSGQGSTSPGKRKSGKRAMVLVDTESKRKKSNLVAKARIIVGESSSAPTIQKSSDDQMAEGGPSGPAEELGKPADQ